MSYNEDSIKTLDWREHIRLRPGMYIGKLGNGSMPEDGIYVLFKEVIDNCIDEVMMGCGDRIEITLDEKSVCIRDFGRGIPLGKVIDCCSKINTGAKYDSDAFKKSVGLNGVGIKAVNALSDSFQIKSMREETFRKVDFSKGILINDSGISLSSDCRGGVEITFTPDAELFAGYSFRFEFIKEMLRFYSWLNPGLELVLNGESFKSNRGLIDLIDAKLTDHPIYPTVSIRGDDVEIAFTHTSNSGEEIYTFVNGQNTTQGGTHLAAFREAIVQKCRDFYKKQYEPSDVRNGIIAAVSVKIQEPIFESQTKTKLGSTHMEQKGRNLKGHILKVFTTEFDNFLHRNSAVIKLLQGKLNDNEKERREVSAIQANRGARRARICNKKLRDCRVHLNTSDRRREESTLFITEGDSASGSITKSRDVNTQAVFSLRGKPLNCFGLTRKVVYENEEFNLLASALNIDEKIEGLRYNNIIIATDADVDGMHIRLLMISFFLQFFPEIIRDGHVCILKTPLFRVRNRKQTFYCYTDQERHAAIARCGANPEITRFKGLGEISPDEFKGFIGPMMRLEPVTLPERKNVLDLLSFYMGKNTPERQDFIVKNLRVEVDAVEKED